MGVFAYTLFLYPWYYRAMQEYELLRPFERVPEELKAHTQCVNWRREDGYKVPVNPSTLGNAGVHWKNTWAPFE